MIVYDLEFSKFNNIQTMIFEKWSLTSKQSCDYYIYLVSLVFNNRLTTYEHPKYNISHFDRINHYPTIVILGAFKLYNQYLIKFTSLPRQFQASCANNINFRQILILYYHFFLKHIMFYFLVPDLTTQMRYNMLHFDFSEAKLAFMHHQTLSKAENLSFKIQALTALILSVRLRYEEQSLQTKEEIAHLSEQIAAIKRVAQIQSTKKTFNKAIVCPHEGCGKGYSSKIALKYHMRMKHLDVSP